MANIVASSLPETTVVTALYSVPSKLEFQKYLEWVANFMALDLRTVIFSDGAALEHLRSRWTESARRIYLKRSLHEFETAKYDWASELNRDPEVKIGHSRELYMIWNEKPFLAASVLDLAPWPIDALAWTDIGSFRDPKLLPRFRGFPDPKQITAGKITMLQIEPFTRKERENVWDMDDRFFAVNRIGGGVFAGDAPTIRWFSTTYRSLLAEAKSRGVFCGKDQILYAYAVLRFPDMFRVIVPPISPHDKWFYLHHFLAPVSFKKSVLEFAETLLELVRRPCLSFARFFRNVFKSFFRAE